MPGKKSTANMTAMLRTTVITLFAAALLVWAGMDVYQRYQFYQSTNNGQPEQTTQSNTSPLLSASDTKTVANQYLFGRQIVETPQVETITKAPATTLKLKLIGVISTDTPGISKVIIQIDDRDVGVYSIGDKLPKGNATIEKVEATQVLLRRNGKLESLAIIRPELEDAVEDGGREDSGLRIKD